jgi:5-methylcytosine-specific restriction protein B
MNTADKSIALVDIALRRRFQFIPKYPDASVILKSNEPNSKEKVNLMVTLNEELRNDKGDFYKGIDFQIGHSYFLKGNNLIEIINNNIIPLLTEYFRNDTNKVKQLLQKANIKTDYDKSGMLNVIM